jgi:hypothetical protein
LEQQYYSNLINLQLGDEQNIADPNVRQQAAIQLAEWRANYPEIIGYTNQYPGYNETDLELRLYTQEAKPDMLCFDAYPFSPYGADMTTMYKWMQRYRLVALDGHDPNVPHGIPYGLYLQTFVLNHDHCPSDSQMRLNQFSAWTFGYKFTSAFVYASSETSGVTGCLFDGLGTTNTSASFNMIAETNRQSQNLGPALIRFASTDIRMIANEHDLPPNIHAWDTSADPYMISITPVNLSNANDGNPGDVLIGYFELLNDSLDGPIYLDQEYFMICNGLTDPSALASETQQRIEVVFNFADSGITSLQRLNRNTGNVEVVSLINLGNHQYKLDLVLDGGTADLFKYNTGAPFVQGQLICEKNLITDISGPEGKPDCYVDIYDLITLATSWLQCNDPLAIECNTF